MKERTLAILKPDSVAAGRAGAILTLLEEEGFRVRGIKRLHLSEDQARAFYAVHRERPFFDALIRFMTEGPIVPLALERDDAVAHLRRTMGATDSEKGNDPQPSRYGHRAQCDPWERLRSERGEGSRVLLRGSRADLGRFSGATVRAC